MLLLSLHKKDDIIPTKLARIVVDIFVEIVYKTKMTVTHIQKHTQFDNG